MFEELRGDNFVFTVEGSIDEHFGIQIVEIENETHMSQPYLIRRIIEAVPGLKDANPVNIPAASTVLLDKDNNGKNRKGKWNYRSIVGMLDFLVNSTHPELAFAVHQCARFYENPKLSHELGFHQITCGRHYQ